MACDQAINKTPLYIGDVVFLKINITHNNNSLAHARNVTVFIASDILGERIEVSGNIDKIVLTTNEARTFYTNSPDLGTLTFDCFFFKSG